MNLSTDSDRIEVNADFDLKKTKYDVDFYVKVRVFTVIALAISFVINYIKNINKTAVPTKARKEVKNGWTSNSRTNEYGYAKNSWASRC